MSKLSFEDALNAIGNVADMGADKQGLRTGTTMSNLSGLGNLDPMSLGSLAPTVQEQRIYSQAKIRVVKAIFGEAPSIMPAVSRPIGIDSSSVAAAESLETLGNMLHDDPFVPVSTLRKLGSQIMSCGADHEGVIALPGGFSTQRLRCLFVFEVEAPNKRYYLVVNGYSNFDDPSHSGLLAPDMRIHFNNVMMLRPTVYQNDLGQTQERLSIVQTDQILTLRDNQADWGIGGFAPSVPKELITPRTVFQRMGTLETNADGGGLLLDTRTRIGMNSGLTLNRRENALGANFFANTMNGILNAATGLDVTNNGGHSITASRIFREAAEQEANLELTPSKEYVFNEIVLNSDFRARGSISYESLTAIFPEILSVGVVDRRAPVSETIATNPSGNAFDLTGLDAFNSESWESTHFTTVKAQQLLIGVPTLMDNCALSAITFTATNMLHGFLTGFELKPTYAASHLGENVDIRPLVELFKREFENRLNPILADGDSKNYVLTCHYDTLGEFRVSIQYDGLDRAYNYQTGAFCDGLYAANQTSNGEHLNLLAGDLATFTKSLLG